MVKFSKMHAQGNDFVILNNMGHTLQLSTKEIARLGDRHRGIGFDQLLMIEAATEENIDFNYLIYNQDGQPAGQCGNGIRCVAQYVLMNQLSKKKELRFKTQDRILQTRIDDSNFVSVDMGKAIFLPEKIPFVYSQQQLEYQLEILGQMYDVGVVSMGNPHCIFFVAQLSSVPIAEIGKFLNTSSWFPQGVNVSFVEVLQADKIKARVFERGVGETLACGSAACAIAGYGNAVKNLARKINIQFPGGPVYVEVLPDNQHIILSGEVVNSFNGEF